MRRHFSSALANGNSRKDSNRATKQIVANTQVLANLCLEKRAIHTPTVFGIFLFFTTTTRQFTRVARALLGPFGPWAKRYVGTRELTSAKYQRPHAPQDVCSLMGTNNPPGSDRLSCLHQTAAPDQHIRHVTSFGSTTDQPGSPCTRSAPHQPDWQASRHQSASP